MTRAHALAITLPATPLTQDQAEAFRRFTVDKCNGDAARRAAGFIALLAQQIGPAELMRHAATLPDGLAWLRELASQADTMREALIQQRRDADAVMEAEYAVRGRLDVAAANMAAELQDAIRHARARLAMIDATASATRANLSSAGLAEDEIQAVLARRTEGGDHEARQLRAKIETDTAKLAAVNLFLRDPMRDTAALPELQLAELEALAEVLRSRQDNPPATTFSLKNCPTQ